MSATASAQLLEPSFTERKSLGLTWIYSGTFILDGTDLTPERCREDAIQLWEQMRQRRPGWWNRGIFGNFLVPIYCAASFSKLTKDSLYGNRRTIRWGGSVMPILFDSQRNRVLAKIAMQNDNMMYYRRMSEWFTAGVARAAAHFGHRPESTSDANDELVARLLALKKNRRGGPPAR